MEATPSSSDGAAQVFRYAKPAEMTKKKAIVRLAKTDLVHCNVQVVREGGENNLHSHSYMDGVWYVLRGRVRFYTTDDEVIGEIGPDEGILIPRGFPYWFGSVGEDDLELLQVEAHDPEAASLKTRDRVDYQPPKPEAPESFSGSEPEGNRS